MPDHEYLERWREAWEEGHAILVYVANKVVAERGLNLVVEESQHVVLQELKRAEKQGRPERKPNPFALLRKANRRFHKYLRFLERPLEDLGIDTEKLQPWLFGNWALSVEEPGSELRSHLDLLCQKTEQGEWVLDRTREESEKHFVAPMRQHAENCRRFFNEIAQKLSTGGAPVVEGLKPHWDTDRGELSFAGQLCKRYRQPAPNQRRVLDAFQEDGWPPKIDNPLPGDFDRQRLADTIRGLNAGNECLRFELDGTGEGILWETRTEPAG